MYKKTVLAAFLIGAGVIAGPASASYEQKCLDAVAESDNIPPEVTQEMIDAYCSCYGGVLDGDDSLAAEVEKLLELPEEERGANASAELIAAEKQCREGIES